MKLHSLLAVVTLTGLAHAADTVPPVFKGLLNVEQPVKGEIGVVSPPVEIDKYIAKVEASARENREWFVEFSANAKPGQPLPYHENLGLTKEEYATYLELWNQREFKPLAEVMLLLRKSTGNDWTIIATGKASTVSTLRYDPEKDSFRSPNGELKRIDDIKADPSSILGEWVGREWRFEEETSLGKTKENIAIGHYVDNSHGLLVYRAQELTAAGTRLLDKSLVIRFPLAKASSSKDQ